LNLDFIQIYKKLDFLTESIRLQYTNLIAKNIEASGLTLDEVVDRIKRDEPIEYIFNSAEFFRNKLFVDKRVLIPRHETELMIRPVIGFTQEFPANYTIIDIGTGSGAIILTLAKILSTKLPDLKFIGIDKSKEAIEVAKINRTKLNLDERVEFIHSDFQSFDFAKYKHLIVCANLPYIPKDRELQKSVIGYEPHLALFGGKKGDELIEKLKSKLKKLPNLKFFIIEKDQGKIEVVG
jgi:release factor glutamine methyltransferase